MKTQVGFRLTDEARELLDALAKQTGISKSARMEIMIRNDAMEDLTEPQLAEIKRRHEKQNVQQESRP